jgi:uncharacterized protein YndB with AHSA1/START domain
MTDSTITVERTINASSDTVFDVLTNPDRHVDLDGSGFVTAVAKGDRLQGVGDTFRMNMTGDHMGGDYQTDNRVTGFDKNHLLSWQTAPAGKEPPGWEWVWELESQGSDQTLVRHTYDWSKVTDQALLAKGLFPLVSAEQLEDTLQRLDQAVTGS